MDNENINAENWQEIVTQKDSRITELDSHITELDSRITELETLVAWYEEQFRLAKQRQFGPKSEKTEFPEQLSLFDEAENTADPNLAEPELEEITYKRRKRAGKREDDLSELPVEVVEHTLPEEERICPQCGEPLHVMGHECRRELKVIPAQVVVQEHKREVYSCRSCEKNGEKATIVKAPLPEPVIKGSLASPSAVAHIMTQKYVMCAPLYRQEQAWKQQGVFLSRQTMANWIIRCSQDWLEPIYERLKLGLTGREVLHSDETVLQVLKEPGRKAQAKSFMWLYRTCGDTEKPIVLYDYQETRHHKHPEAFLQYFRGYLHTDGFQGYHLLPQDITVVGCWSHARRKFDEALKTVAQERRPGSHAQKGQDFCNRLFDLERKYAKLEPQERFERRLEESQPLAEEFFVWAQSLGALPKSALGVALKYACDQRQWLMNVYLDGRLEISNNRAERSIKPFVMGRKNWLFCNTPKGARASSVVYSLIETAKENGLKPFEYLEFLLETLPNTTTGMLDELLPWGAAVPERCRIPRKKEDEHANQERA